MIDRKLPVAAACYEVPLAGGSFQHRAMDCPIHGESVVFATPYRKYKDPRPAEPYFCVQCALEALKEVHGNP
jgi:hypothetical protein